MTLHAKPKVTSFSSLCPSVDQRLLASCSRRESREGRPPRTPYPAAMLASP
jgi:hypothetical protein